MILSVTRCNPETKSALALIRRFQTGLAGEPAAGELLTVPSKTERFEGDARNFCNWNNSGCLIASELEEADLRRKPA